MQTELSDFGNNAYNNNRYDWLTTMMMMMIHQNDIQYYVFTSSPYVWWYLHGYASSREKCTESIRRFNVYLSWIFDWIDEILSAVKPLSFWKGVEYVAWRWRRLKTERRNKQGICAFLLFYLLIPFVSLLLYIF